MKELKWLKFVDAEKYRLEFNEARRLYAKRL